MTRVSTFLSWLSAALLSGFNGSDHTCSEIILRVAATSQNVIFAKQPDPTNEQANLDFVADLWKGSPPELAGTTEVTGNFTLSATYCLPKSLPNPPTLQILVHGITYNKTIWSGLGFSPEKYNWHNHANTRGYATLAIDRLGHGLSSSPDLDPLLTIQPQLHLEILHQIISGARSGGLHVSLGKKFNRIIFTGHSYGSLLGAATANKYPLDIDALVLTGFSTSPNFATVAGAKWRSAPAIEPLRFGHRGHGHITMSDETERTDSSYGGRYDRAIAAADFKYGDTVTTGEFGAMFTMLTPAAGYKGPVLVVTGVDDKANCATPAEKCREILRKTGDEFFPNVRDYEFIAPQETGHNWMVHESAGATAGRVHDWLDRRVRGKVEL